MRAEAKPTAREHASRHVDSMSPFQRDVIQNHQQDTGMTLQTIDHVEYCQSSNGERTNASETYFRNVLD